MNMKTSIFFICMVLVIFICGCLPDVPYVPGI
jgi:hypothetical protein